MKSRKYINLLLSVLVGISASLISLPTFADGNEMNESQITEELQEFFADYIENESQDEIFKCEVEYKVYNSDNRLIRFGSLEDCRIKCLVSRCDYLTEVDGTKYFRLYK